MRLLVGLGNPGPEYAGHRHNIGFMAVARIATRHAIGPWKTRFQGHFCEGRLGGDKVMLLRPNTYMNESGRSVGEAMRFFQLDLADLVVFHDELDLAFGRLRVKTGGGAAGNNGIRSISGHLGPDYMRVRLGIGHPGHKELVTRHVLGNFSKDEKVHVDAWLDAVADATPRLVDGDTAGFMTAVAQKCPAPKPTQDKEARTDGV
ncbi:MAG: aminoacyl-tRNA hydrolase [Pseudomonadota bacterium]|nr:aminoacyl-tRNA hydrolase [Pseudomonadota bacterium]